MIFYFLFYYYSAIIWHYIANFLQQNNPFSTGLFQSLHPGLQSLDLSLTQQQPISWPMERERNEGKGRTPMNPSLPMPAPMYSPNLCCPPSCAFPDSCWPSHMPSLTHAGPLAHSHAFFLNSTNLLGAFSDLYSNSSVPPCAFPDPCNTSCAPSPTCTSSPIDVAFLDTSTHSS